MKVFVTRALPLDARAIAPPGVTVEVSPVERALTREEIVAGARDADALVPLLTDTIDATVIDASPRLRVIANYAVGVNNIDLGAAKARGIVVCNTPDVLTDATADLTMTLMLMQLRRVREAERVLRAGAFDGWSPTLLLGGELRRRVLGIFGFGRIGRAVARRALAFGMRVQAASRREITEPGVRRVALDELLRTSDVISLHAPLTDETRLVLGARAFAAMKADAIVVNTARGPLIDEAALVAALEQRRIAGAALDVFEDEPRVHPALLGRDDVVLLPHVGSGTREAREAMARLALENCFAVLAGGVAKTPV